MSSPVLLSDARYQLHPENVMNSRQKLENSIGRLAAWVEERDYKGYDPGDGLNSFLRPLAFGNRLAERVLLQVIWKSPLNLRPLVGIKPMDSTKGRGYMAWGYLLRHKTTQDSSQKAKALACLDWLIANKAPGHSGYSWGNHFDFVTRSGVNPAGSPIIVWTSLIGQAFLEAYEQTGDGRFLEVARGACAWILKLPREETPSGTCLSYVPFAQSSIHNSNMLGAAMLASTWRHTHEPELLEVARSAILYSCSRQRADGDWWYGEQAKYHWIDSFHTGYNLDSLKRYLDSTGDESFRDHFQRGLRYFRDVFFEPDGMPRYYHDKTYPVDIQCAAQAIETLAFCSDEDPACLNLSLKVAEWTVDNMQDRKGCFYFRQYPMMKAKTPYIHWGQATMFKALASLLSKTGG
jgi:polysaccharide biosynthesis protein VpsJ